MSATARYAEYVIAPTMSLEIPAASFMNDLLNIAGLDYGPEVPFAQYTEAVAQRPAGSDLIEEWEFFYGLAQRMGLQLQIDRYVYVPQPPHDLDMVNKPTSEELIELMASYGEMPLDEVKQYPHGFIRESTAVVGPKDEGWEARLELASQPMMDDLDAVSRAAADRTTEPDTSEFPFRLICRRMQRHFNSSWIGPSTNRGRGYNPAYMHPDDLRDLGLQPGDSVELSSARSMIPAVVEADDTLRRGLVSMAHGFGDAPDRDDEFREIGSPVGRLLDGTDFLDAYCGHAKMSDVPVAVRAMALDPR
jgi:anaerobic selenocysteine-containing dehydrogenase